MPRPALVDRLRPQMWRLQTYTPFQLRPASVERLFMVADRGIE